LAHTSRTPPPPLVHRVATKQRLPRSLDPCSPYQRCAAPKRSPYPVLQRCFPLFVLESFPVHPPLFWTFFIRWSPFSIHPFSLVMQGPPINPEEVRRFRVDSQNVSPWQWREIFPDLICYRISTLFGGPVPGTCMLFVHREVFISQPPVSPPLICRRFPPSSPFTQRPSSCTKMGH